MGEVITQPPPGEFIRPHIPEPYLDPELLDPDDVERILKEGEVQNIHPIEEIEQAVPEHADRVLVGDLEHKDLAYSAEIVLPEGKKLLVVYKPESGVGQGPMKGKEIELPKESSPYANKEAAAWIAAKTLGLGHLTAPVVLRSLDEGLGSLRPYIWGEPLEIISPEARKKAYSRRERLEEIALFDYLLQTIDRRLSNLLWTEDDKLKAIDHSLTFFNESFAERWHKKGPRLMVAYDNAYEPPHLRKTPLPEKLVGHLQGFVDSEQGVRGKLAELLTEEEINDIFERAQKMLKEGIFL